MAEEKTTLANDYLKEPLAATDQAVVLAVKATGLFKKVLAAAADQYDRGTLAKRFPHFTYRDYLERELDRLVLSLRASAGDSNEFGLLATALLARRVAHLEYAGTRGWSEANWCVRLRPTPTHGLEIPSELLAIHEEYLEYSKGEASRRITEKALAAVARDPASSSSSASFDPSPESRLPATPGLGRAVGGASRRLAKKKDKDTAHGGESPTLLPLANPRGGK
jgi:hypothetical protein